MSLRDSANRKFYLIVILPISAERKMGSGTCDRAYGACGIAHGACDM